MARPWARLLRPHREKNVFSVIKISRILKILKTTDY
jgi:hypothetical protein